MVRLPDSIYRLSTFIPQVEPGGLVFNQFLIKEDAPLLFHTGMRGIFPLVREAVAKLIPPETLRWISFGHYEADECGSMNAWVAVAPNAQVAHRMTAVGVSLNDQADRAPRILAHGDVMDLGGKRARYLDTPHVPHGWEAGLITRRPRAPCSAATSSHSTAKRQSEQKAIVGAAIASEDIAGYSALDPAMGSDSRWVVFSGLTPGTARCEIWSVRIDGSSVPGRLSPAGDGGCEFHGFALSAEGPRAVFLGDFEAPGTTELWSARTDRNEPAVKLSPAPVAGGDVSWPFVLTEDETRVLFVSDALLDDNNDLWMAPVDGGATAIRLNTSPASPRHVVADSVTVARDGSRVLYLEHSGFAGRPDLWSAPVDGSAWQGDGTLRVPRGLVALAKQGYFLGLCWDTYWPFCMDVHRPYFDQGEDIRHKGKLHPSSGVGRLETGTGKTFDRGDREHISGIGTQGRRTPWLA